MSPSTSRKIGGIVVLLVFALGWGYGKYYQAQKQAEKNVADPQTQVRELHLFAMSDYFPEAVIKGFEKKFNARVKYDNFANNEELLAKFQAGTKGYDVIVPSDYMVRALIEGKYLMELDKTKIPNIKNIGKDFVEAPYDQGAKFSVPYTWGTTGLVYNTKFVKEPITSWKQLFDPKYKGKIALLDDMREALGAMLHMKGNSANTTSSDQLKDAQAELMKLKPNVRLFSSDPKQHVLSGDIWIAQIYSGDAAQVSGQKPELKYVVPKEGSTVWIDTLAIPNSARDADLAHSFINYILEPETAKTTTTELGYSSPNTAIENLIDQADLKASHLRKLGLKTIEFLKDLGPATEQWDQLWTEAKTR